MHPRRDRQEHAVISESRQIVGERSGLSATETSAEWSARCDHIARTPSTLRLPVRRARTVLWARWSPSAPAPLFGAVPDARRETATRSRYSSSRISTRSSRLWCEGSWYDRSPARTGPCTRPSACFRADRRRDACTARRPQIANRAWRTNPTASLLRSRPLESRRLTEAGPRIAGSNPARGGRSRSLRRSPPSPIRQSRTLQARPPGK